MSNENKYNLRMNNFEKTLAPILPFINESTNSSDNSDNSFSYAEENICNDTVELTLNTSFLSDDNKPDENKADNDTSVQTITTNVERKLDLIKVFPKFIIPLSVIIAVSAIFINQMGKMNNFSFQTKISDKMYTENTNESEFGETLDTTVPISSTTEEIHTLTTAPETTVETTLPSSETEIKKGLGEGGFGTQTTTTTTTTTTTPALTSISSENVITEVTDFEIITEPINNQADYIQEQEDSIVTSVERIEYNGLENNMELFNLIYSDINMNNRLTITLNGNSNNKQMLNCIEIGNDEYNRIDFYDSNNWRKISTACGTYEKKEYSESKTTVITLYGKIALSTYENGEWDYSNAKDEQIKIVITNDEKGKQHIGVVDTIN